MALETWERRPASWTTSDFKLLPNVNVGVTIITAEHRNVLTVPREAIRQDDSKAYVYQIVNNELQRRYVQTSISNLTQVEVTGGLPENALIALGPTNSKPLRNGLVGKGGSLRDVFSLKKLSIIFMLLLLPSLSAADSTDSRSACRRAAWMMRSRRCKRRISSAPERR